MIRTRRWLQFSLRTFLMSVSALSFVCGSIAIQVHRAREQQEAVLVIQQFGGEVFYEYNEYAYDGYLPPVLPRPPWWKRVLRNILGHDYADNVNAVTLPRRDALPELVLPSSDMPLQPLRGDGAHRDDEALQSIGTLHKLSSLGLAQTDISDAGLACLAGLKDLESLDLADTAISDNGLVHLSPLSALAELDLTATRISDAGVAHLKRLKNLRRLVLFQTRVTPAGLSELREALPECKIVTHPKADQEVF